MSNQQDVLQARWGCRIAYLGMLLGSIVLAGCGGGGGGSNPPLAPLHTIGGAITGLDGSVVLRNNGGNDLTRTANGAFTFSAGLASGSAYSVTIATQPSGQSCQVMNATGTVGTGPITNVSVACQNTASGTGDASLSSLSLSTGALDQAFDAGRLAYTSTQPFPVSSVQITPVTQASGATVSINGSSTASGQPSQPLALTAGATTTATITVTSASGTTTRAYTIDITRQTGSGFAQQAYIKASNPDGVADNPAGAGDQFGYTTALSADGNTLAVAALYESSNATGVNGSQSNNLASESGAVYVFGRVNGTWTQQAYVKASNTGSNDGFGQSLALSSNGDTLVVGAAKEDSHAVGVNGDQSSNAATNSGAAYVFTRSGGTWTQQAYVKASNTGATFDELDYFGWSVALSGSGNTLAVGAPGEGSNATGINGSQTNNSAAGSGAAYIFTRTGSTWNQQAYVKASNTQENDGFGTRIALSSGGDTLAVSAVGEDSNTTGSNGDQSNNAASRSGAVYVFAFAAGNWSQQAYLKASNAGAGDEFGSDISLSGDGNTLAVTANGEDSAATGIDGNQLDNTAADSGAAYVFTRNSGAWAQQAYLKASNTGAGDNFGWSVALSGNGDTLAVSARDEDSAATGIDGAQNSSAASNSGAAYVFGRSGNAWTQRAYVKASNTDAGDRFGMSIALSGDAGTLAIGADGEDSGATGINGDQTGNTLVSSGSAYVFATGSP